MATLMKKRFLCLSSHHVKRSREMPGETKRKHEVQDERVVTSQDRMKINLNGLIKAIRVS